MSRKTYANDCSPDWALSQYRLRNPLPVEQIPASGLEHCRLSCGDCRTWIPPVDDGDKGRLRDNCNCQRESRDRIRLENLQWPNGSKIDAYELDPVPLLWFLSLQGIEVALVDGALKLSGESEVVEKFGWVADINAVKLANHLTDYDWANPPDPMEFDPASLERPATVGISQEDYEFAELAGSLEDGGMGRIEAERQARVILRRNRPTFRPKSFDRTSPNSPDAVRIEVNPVVSPRVTPDTQLFPNDSEAADHNKTKKKRGAK